jgi:hypothetical protein
LGEVESLGGKWKRMGKRINQWGKLGVGDSLQVDRGIQITMNIPWENIKVGRILSSGNDAS